MPKVKVPDYTKMHTPLVEADGWTHDLLQSSYMGRIAEAVELMARDRQRLVDDRDHWQLAYEEQFLRANQLERSRRSLKGRITFLRKRKESNQ